MAVVFRSKAASQASADLARQLDQCAQRLPISVRDALPLGLASAGGEPHERRRQADRIDDLMRAAWARRQLALVLARRGNESCFQEAVALLQSNLTISYSIADMRALARVLGSKPEHAAEALQLLQGTLTHAPLNTADRLLLAELLETTGDLSSAREQWLMLLAAAPKDRSLLESFIRSLRRWGEEEEAAVWAQGLKAPEADSPRSPEVD